MSKIKAWLISFRLRTLPLALSCIFMGSFIALSYHSFRWNTLIWASTTTLFLQILSNLANDYGDAVSGADNDQRLGPKRMIQSGTITLNEMRKAILILALLALTSGLILLITTFQEASLTLVLFLVMGIAAIGAAIRYTVGKNPYGYRGLGDLYVFIFFGLLGVTGTFYLHAGTWDWPVLLPASAIGLFSTGVLNLNNIRDIESDKKSNKRTMAVLLGKEKAAWYHLFLLTSGWTALLLWVFWFSQEKGAWLVLLAIPIFARSVWVSFSSRPSQQLDPELRNLSLGTLFTVLMYGSGFLLK
jgi:1,4-dihydroxy-2-naphthoate octaprenyltransferase